MSYDPFEGCLPKDKYDLTSVIRLLELTDDEIVAVSDRLFELFCTVDEPAASVVTAFLIAKQDLIIDRVKEFLDSNQEEKTMGYGRVIRLVSYLSMDNQTRLIPSLERIILSYPEDRKLNEGADIELDVLMEYRKKRDLCSFGSCYDNEKVRNLFTLTDVDARSAVRILLYDFVEIFECIRIPAVVFMTAKQDLFVNDVKLAYDTYAPGAGGEEFRHGSADREARFRQRRYQKKWLLEDKIKLEKWIEDQTNQKYVLPSDEMTMRYVNIDFDPNYSVQYYRQFLYDNLICFFTKENQERILGGISTGNNLLQT